MCDASDFAVGAVLGKRIDKHFRPIHYVSKMMTEAESNYITTEKEMLAVVYAFEKFRSYLIMNKSIVYTDHSALNHGDVCLSWGRWGEFVGGRGSGGDGLESGGRGVVVLGGKNGQNESLYLNFEISAFVALVLTFF
nr:reverse transcriptase domain-containing protein [Tanacetum cinerariifolium]